MIFKEEADYVRYSMRHFRKLDGSVCSGEHEQDVKAVGAYQIVEGGYTEGFIHLCQECLDRDIQKDKEFFNNPDAEMFYCDCCDTENMIWRKNDDNSLERRLFVFKDPEDGTLHDLCEGCYKQRKQEYYRLFDD